MMVILSRMSRSLLISCAATSRRKSSSHWVRIRSNPQNLSLQHLQASRDQRLARFSCPSALTSFFISCVFLLSSSSSLLSALPSAGASTASVSVFCVFSCSSPASPPPSSATPSAPSVFPPSSAAVLNASVEGAGSRLVHRRRSSDPRRDSPFCAHAQVCVHQGHVAGSQRTPPFTYHLHRRRLGMGLPQ